VRLQASECEIYGKGPAKSKYGAWWGPRKPV